MIKMENLIEKYKREESEIFESISSTIDPTTKQDLVKLKEKYDISISELIRISIKELLEKVNIDD